jgi:hypothetical protein
LRPCRVIDGVRWQLTNLFVDEPCADDNGRNHEEFHHTAVTHALA